ncbi:MAG: hypothetical protein ACI8PT_003951 [Gammaproteobacteria bacterium]
MSEPTPLFLERRFPVGLDPVIGSIRELYDESKAAHWDPQADIPWATFAAHELSDEQRNAGCLSWSRRAWIEYTALAETPSLLVRFCIERGREADPKFYLTVRNTEEAWHIECCHQYAELCGGYQEQPATAAFADNLNRNFHREVLHAHTPLDAYVAAHCAVSDGLELALWQGYLANAKEPVARAILERAVNDKTRHAAFGWLYLDARQAHWDDETRGKISGYVHAHVTDVELSGYHVSSLGDNEDTAVIGQADTISAQAKLGALSPAEERTVAGQFFASAYERLGALGLTMPKLVDPRVGL